MKKIAILNKISPIGLARLPQDYQIVEDIQDADAVIVRSAAMHDISFSQRLLAIARAGAGVNNIPVEACAAQGIVVFNSPGANANAVKELIFGAMLMYARNLLGGVQWEQSLAGSEEDVLKVVEKGKSKFAGTEILGKTLGVIGLGAIGVAVANQAESMGMKVVCYSHRVTELAAQKLSKNIPISFDLNEVLAQADYLSLNVPAKPGTIGMINDQALEALKDGCVILNFARNTLVEESTIIKGLASGKLGGYITDFATNGLLNVEGVLAIPHLGASTKEAEDNCAIMAANEVTDYIENGNILNSVNYPACSLGPVKDGVPRICILSQNVEGLVAKVTNTLAAVGLNIKEMTSKEKNSVAYLLLDVEGSVSPDQAKALESLEGIIRVRIIA